MNFAIHIDTIGMGLPIVYLRGQRYNFLNYDVYLSSVDFQDTRSLDPDQD